MIEPDHPRRGQRERLVAVGRHMPERQRAQHVERRLGMRAIKFLGRIAAGEPRHHPLVRRLGDMLPEHRRDPRQRDAPALGQRGQDDFLPPAHRLHRRRLDDQRRPAGALDEQRRHALRIGDQRGVQVARDHRPGEPPYQARRRSRRQSAHRPNPFTNCARPPAAIAPTACRAPRTAPDKATAPRPTAPPKDRNAPRPSGHPLRQRPPPRPSA